MLIITSLLAFLLAIAILVPFHEYGHFSVARLCGVKVLRFAVGFGKVLWSHRSQSGVEYCLCAVPLGGYVKMLDEREGPVATEALPFAFNRQPVWKRFLIVLAGPVFNLVLAAFLLWGVFVIGLESAIPSIGALEKSSPAYQSGLRSHDEIVSVEGHPTQTVDNFFQIVTYYLEEPSVSLTVKRNGQEKTVTLDPNVFKDIATIFSWPAELGTLTPGGPAIKAGLKSGDTVVRINQQPMGSWDVLIKTISAHPNETLSVNILRDHTPMHFNLTTGTRADGTGMIGAHFPESYMRLGRLAWPFNAQEAVKQTIDLVKLNFKMIAHMATGRASFDNIGGPVSIAYAAGVSAERGLVTYLHFLAMISVGLAVLNLLPIPMLDGGHLLFYMVEMIIRRPLSDSTQEMALRVGIIILLSLMLLALFNDMMRWV